MKLRTPMLLPLAFALACGPIPGGRLSGKITEPPPAWKNVLDGGHGFCEIESRPADPHSIQLDCFIYEDALYAQSHRWALAPWWPVESWAAIWIANPDVKVRIGDAIYELTAVQVQERAERDAILRLRGYDPPPEGIVVFRFDPRSGAHGEPSGAPGGEAEPGPASPAG